MRKTSRSRNGRQAKQKFWAGIVWTPGQTKSNRHTGDFSCFVATSKESAVKQAQQAAQNWDKFGTRNYAVAVAPLTSLVRERKLFEVVKL